MRILLEQGGAAGLTPGTPEPNFTEEFDSWPIPGAEAMSLFLQPDGGLSATAPMGADASASL